MSLWQVVAAALLIYGAVLAALLAIAMLAAIVWLTRN